MGYCLAVWNILVDGIIMDITNSLPFTKSLFGISTYGLLLLPPQLLLKNKINFVHLRTVIDV